MAKKTTVELVDDIDGSVAAESVTFGLDGVGFEIDLSAENAEKLREALGVWVADARRVSGRRSRGSAVSASKGDASKIREWARAEGLSVTDRGRISAEVREAFDAAH